MATMVLATLNERRRELATLYRDARAGRVNTRDATRLAYILDMLRKAYETCVLQDRLEQIEKRCFLV